MRVKIRYNWARIVGGRIVRGTEFRGRACVARPSSLMRAGRAALLLFTLAFLSACSFIPREQFTAEEQAIARVPAAPNARFWADGGRAELQAFLHSNPLSSAILSTGRFDILAISGGAYDGAYGAGVINGWTASGTRPRFTVVTGVSAGALIAPFAFLGPEYDNRAAEAFTSGVASVLGDVGGALMLLGTPDLRRQTLSDLVEKHIDRAMLEAIAAEHARGRHLLVVTTNLDAQRAVVWDMGAIAASRNPDALQLFRDVLVASASIPGVFAPTYIEVEANGHRFREMHVDGGATTQVFIVPDIILATGMGIANPKRAPTHVWVIVNNHITPQFEVVELGVLPTISRSFSTLIKNSAKGTLFATSRYFWKKQFNLSYIDNCFDQGLKAYAGPDVKPGFNQAYMSALYRYGYEKARTSELWTHQVPLPGRESHSHLMACRRPPSSL